MSAAISLVLRLLGKDPDPAKSREHVLLSVLAERRLQQGQTAELGSLLDEVLTPPIERVGALDVNDFLPSRIARASPPPSTPCSPPPPSPAGARAAPSTSASGSRPRTAAPPPSS